MRSVSGIRTSEDLGLAVAKRAIPRLLAMVDSPIGDQDAALQALGLEILSRIAALQRSGTR